MAAPRQTPPTKSSKQGNLSDLESYLESSEKAAIPRPNPTPSIASVTPISATPAPTPLARAAATPELRKTTKERWKTWAIIVPLLVALLLASVVFWLVIQSNREQARFSRTGVGDYGVLPEPLAEITSEASVLTVTSAGSQFTVNGQFNLNGRAVLAATTRPTNPVAGELWYQENDNKLYFYDGAQYVDISYATSVNAAIAAAVQSVQGQTGAVTLAAGPGINVAGTTISNSGVISLESGSSLITVTDAGNGKYIIGDASGGGGGINLQVATPGVAQSGNANITGTFIAGQFQGGGGGLTGLNAGNITSGTVADGRLSTNVTLQGNTFNNANQLVQLNGAAELPAVNGVNLTNLNASNIATGTLFDGRLSTNVTLQGNTFNGANQLVQLTALGYLPAVNGSLVTNLNGSSIATGTVADARLSANVALLNANQVFSGANTFSGTVTAGTITSTGSLTIGNASQSLLLQGSSSSTFTANSGANSTTVGFTGSATGDVIYNFDMATTPGTYAICTSAGNCGSGSGQVTTLGGTTNKLSKFTGAQSIGDSSISDTGTSVTIIPTSNSTDTFRVQNVSSTDVLLVDTTNGRVAVGQSTANYALDVNGDINSATGLRVGGNLVCDVNGCASSGGSGFYIQNSVTTQTNANFNIQSVSAASVTGVLKGAISQSADIFQAQNSSGTPLAKITAAGNVDIVGNYFINGTQISSANLSNDANLAKLNGTQTFTGNNTFTGTSLLQNATNSTAAFQIQNAAGTSNLFIADTTNTRVGIGKAPGYMLDVNGDVNITSGSSYRINGVAICGPSATCAPSAGSNNYVQNGTTVQTNTNFNIQSASAGSVVGILRGASGQTANLFEVQTSTPTTVLSVSSIGEAIFRNSTNSNSAFEVRRANGSAMFAIDTVNAFTSFTGNIYAGSNINVQGTSLSANNAVVSGRTFYAGGESGNIPGSITFRDENGSWDTILQPNYSITADRQAYLPDETGVICMQLSSSCGFAVSSGSGNYIQNGTSAQTANFNVTGTGVIGTSLTTPAIASASNLTFSTNGTTRFTLTSGGVLQGSNASTISAPGSGTGSERFGAGATTGTGNSSTALGASASATGNSATALGYNAVASNDGTIALGFNANVTTASAIGIGYAATSSGNSSVAVGPSATASGNSTVAIGVSANAGSAGAVAIGSSATATGFYSVALGFGATTGAHSNSIALGKTATATAGGQFIVGGDGASITQGYFGEGVTNATPQTFTLNATGGSGTNIAGAGLQLAGGRGTGNQAGGDLVFQASAAGSSGTTLNALTERMRIAASGAITIGTANTNAVTIGNSTANVQLNGGNNYFNGNTTVLAGNTFSVQSGYATITGLSTGSNTTLRVNNHVSTGSILVLQDAAADVFTVADGGSVLSKNIANSTTAFQVQNSAGSSVLTVDTVNSNVISGGNLIANGYLRLTGTGTDSFVTPVGSSVPTKINIPAFSVGSFGQVIALGADSGSQSTARVLSLFDARTGSHQPTLAIFNPAETQAIGFSWDGSNTMANLKTLDASSGATPGISIFSGNLTGGGSTTTGQIMINSGNTNNTGGSSGDVYLQSGANSGFGATGNIYIATGYGGATAGSVIVRNGTNKVNAFSVQDTGSNAILSVDTTNGFVGIGNAAPGNRLSVGTLSTAKPGIQVAISTGGISNQGLVVQGVAGQESSLQQWQDSAGTVLLLVAADGRLGSSTASAVATNSRDTVISTGNSNVSGNSGNLYLSTGNAISGNSGNIYLGSGTASTTPGAVIVKNGNNSITAFQVQNASSATVLNVDTSNRRVGINNAAPGAALDVATSGSVTGLAINAASGFSGDLLDLQVNGSRQVRISSDGTYYFGNAADCNGGCLAEDVLSFSYTGTIQASTGGQLNLVSSQVNSNAPIKIGDSADYSYVSFVANGSEDWSVGTDDNSPAGTDSFSVYNYANDRYYFSIANNGVAFFENDATNDVAQFIGTGGSQCTVVTGTGWSCSSDERLKTNITAIDPSNALSKISQLQGVTFNWLSDPSGTQQDGFIAQAVQQVLPELVTTDANGFLSLNKDGLFPFLVGAIQEQQKQINTVQSQQASANEFVMPTDATFANLNVSGNTSFANLTVTGSASIGVNLNVGGDLIVAGTTTTQALKVNGKIIGNPDTRGQVIMTAGATEKEYRFNVPYEAVPNIVVSPTSNPGAQYWVGNITKEGFTVFMATSPTADVTFNFQGQQ